MPHLPSFASLRLRLALWYLLVLGLVLAVFAAGIYLTVRQSLLHSLDSSLAASALTVSQQVLIGPTDIDYPSGDAPTIERGLAVYLFDSRGRLRARIASSSVLRPQPALLRAALAGHDGYTVEQGQRLYMVGLRDASGHLVGAIQVMRSLAAVDAQLRSLLLALLITTPCLLGVATLGGVFLAGRALAPIDRITRTAQAISGGTLTQRLALTPRDDEVGRLAATFDRMLDRLEHAFAQQRQFVADASHELRTPLTIIKGDLDVLLRRPRVAEEYEAVARDVDDEVTRLSSLVEDLLTLARADSGQAELAQELIRFDTLVEEVVQSARRLADPKHIALESSLARGISLVGDPARLRQLILNLLANAVKYSSPGGAVRVTLAARADRARLEVADSGCGIAADDLPHIFDRFYRADKARVRAEGGSGLGLAIARWCAEAHGGTIAAESAPGRGSRFTVWLPGAMGEAP